MISLKVVFTPLFYGRLQSSDITVVYKMSTTNAPRRPGNSNDSYKSDDFIGAIIRVHTNLDAWYGNKRVGESATYEGAIFCYDVKTSSLIIRTDVQNSIGRAYFTWIRDEAITKVRSYFIYEFLLTCLHFMCDDILVALHQNK